MYVSIFSIAVLGSFRYRILILVICHCFILYNLISFFLFCSWVWLRHVFNENIDQWVNQVGHDVRCFFTFIMFTNVFNFYLFHTIFIYIFTYILTFIFTIYIFIYSTLSNKMPVQTWRTRVKTTAISDPDNVPVEAHSTNEKATLLYLIVGGIK